MASCFAFENQGIGKVEPFTLLNFSPIMTIE